MNWMLLAIPVAPPTKNPLGMENAARPKANMAFPPMIPRILNKLRLILTSFSSLPKSTKFRNYSPQISL